MENKLGILNNIYGAGSERQTSIALSSLISHDASIKGVESGSFRYVIFEHNNITSFSRCLNPTISNIVDYVNRQNIKEGFYITAIDNLIKKNEYLQLTIQLDQELISEEDFENELEENEEKYLIKMNTQFSHDYFTYITEILPKLNREFSSDDVSEMFSVPIDEVNSYLDSVLNETK